MKQRCSGDQGSLLGFNILSNNKVMHKSVTHIRELIKTSSFFSFFKRTYPSISFKNISVTKYKIDGKEEYPYQAYLV